MLDEDKVSQKPIKNLIPELPYLTLPDLSKKWRQTYGEEFTEEYILRLHLHKKIQLLVKLNDVNLHIQYNHPPIYELEEFQIRMSLENFANLKYHQAFLQFMQNNFSNQTDFWNASLDKLKMTLLKAEKLKILPDLNDPKMQMETTSAKNDIEAACRKGSRGFFELLHYDIEELIIADCIFLKQLKPIYLNSQLYVYPHLNICKKHLCALKDEILKTEDYLKTLAPIVKNAKNNNLLFYDETIFSKIRMRADELNKAILESIRYTVSKNVSLNKNTLFDDLIQNDRTCIVEKYDPEQKKLYWIKQDGFHASLNRSEVILRITRIINYIH
ncbi:MAG: hypothetical protein V4629_02475 [Pseudomonadota bacterium]